MSSVRPQGRVSRPREHGPRIGGLRSGARRGGGAERSAVGESVPWSAPTDGSAGWGNTDGGEPPSVLGGRLARGRSGSEDGLECELRSRLGRPPRGSEPGRPGGHLEVVQHLANRERVGEERDEPHPLAAGRTDQWPGVVDSGQQPGPGDRAPGPGRGGGPGGREHRRHQRAEGRVGGEVVGSSVASRSSSSRGVSRTTVRPSWANRARW